MANGHPHFTEAELAWRRAREREAQRLAQRLIARDRARAMQRCLAFWGQPVNVRARVLADRIGTSAEVDPAGVQDAITWR